MTVVYFLYRFPKRFLIWDYFRKECHFIENVYDSKIGRASSISMAERLIMEHV